MIYKNAEEEREQLLKAMDDFKAHLKVNKQQSIIKDDTKIYTWDEVVTVVNKAARDYERKKQGRSMAWVGSLFDTVGKNGKTFNAWLSLLPDGDYSSVACGAFKLIINVSLYPLAVRGSKVLNRALPLVCDTLPQSPQKGL